MATKYIMIPTAEKTPDYGQYIVLDNEGQLLITRYNEYSTEEWFKRNYPFWLRKVPDIEIELQQTLNETHGLLTDSIDLFIGAKRKIEEYQKQIEKTIKDGN